MTDESSNEWHLDKRVPIALIAGMFGQVAVVVWGAAVMFKDIEANRNTGEINAQSISVLDERLRSSERATGSQAVQLGRIEESVRGMRGDVNRLLKILERQLE